MKKRHVFNFTAAFGISRKAIFASVVAAATFGIPVISSAHTADITKSFTGPRLVQQASAYLARVTPQPGDRAAITYRCPDPDILVAALYVRGHSVGTVERDIDRTVIDAVSAAAAAHHNTGEITISTAAK